MTRSIKITWATSHYIFGRHDAYRVRIETACAEGVPEAIFAYRMQPVDPSTGERAGTFSHICSPVDLEEFPASEPRSGEVPAWFRLNYVDVLLRSVTEAEAFIEDVLDDVRRLKASLDAVDAVEPAGSQDYGGDPCPEAASSSSSESASGSSESAQAYGDSQSVTVYGRFEQNVGLHGREWEAVAGGAATPLGSEDSQGSGSDSESAGYSRVELYGRQLSRMLLLQGFDLDSHLSEEAEILGLEARILVRDSENSGAELLFLRIYDPNQGLVGENQAAGLAIGGPGWQEHEFGGSDDLWEAVLDAPTIRRGDFGLGLLVKLPLGLLPTSVEVDGAALTVHFREPEA